MNKLNILFESTIESRQFRKILNPELGFNQIVYGEFEVLFLLNKIGAMQPTQISDHLHRQPATVSRYLKMLESIELIHYTYDRANRRRVNVKISLEGETLIKSLIKKLS